jgi:3',5'-nucleoside bisphosphate phosphatase
MEPNGRRLYPADAVDFHLHTIASDGGWTPEQLIDYLANHRFRMAAVCDHDTMRSVPEAIERGEKHGITVIPGVEVTTFWDKRQWHLLVYGVDPALPRSQRFRALIERQEEALRAAAERGITALENNGYLLPSLEIVVDDLPLLPVHVLRTAIKDGHASNLMTAHQLTTKLGEAMRVDAPLDETVDAAREAGGICVIAHPGRNDGGGILSSEQLDRMLAEVKIDGLEGHYRSYSDDDTAKYRTMAFERNLVVTSGSDSHAPEIPVNPKPHPARWTGSFLRRLGYSLEAYSGASWEPGAPDAHQLRDLAETAPANTD